MSERGVLGHQRNALFEHLQWRLLHGQGRALVTRRCVRVPISLKQNHSLVETVVDFHEIFYNQGSNKIQIGKTATTVFLFSYSIYPEKL